MADRGTAVAITGMGAVSPLGAGRDRFWHALCAGESGIAPLAGTNGVPRLAARIVDFSPRDVIRTAHLRRMDALSRSIVAASRLALADARLDDGAVPAERAGIVVGSAVGNLSESVQYLERLFAKGPALASPMMFPNLVLNAPASYAAMEIGYMGATLTVSAGEVSGEQAVVMGCELIRAGRADIVVAGGGDELNDAVLAAYRRWRALSSQRGGPEWCSPYDVDRNGVVLGEGAGMLVLESPAHAWRRGATVYAEIEDFVSFGVAAPTYDWPRHAPRAAERLRQFLGRWPSPADGVGVDLVCGSANSSRRLDACELEVLGRLFGEAASGVMLTSIKGAVGEFGAAGALTAVAASLALHHGAVPPLCSLRSAPPDAPFRFAARTAAARPLGRALVFSMARGGATVALLLRRPAGPDASSLAVR